MPYVSCPTCGERGKIPSGLIGVRIKCKQCGLSFLVSPPAAKAVSAAGATAPAGVVATASTGPSAAVEAQGIEVEGLDASSWTVPTEVGMPSRPKPTTPHTPPRPAVAPHRPRLSRSPRPAGTREYKILTPRDKIFDGRFDLARLEEALNHFSRQGWVAKSMLTPHIKGFTGALEETIIVLLERCKEAT